jgi:hypothetical protein
MNGLRKAFKSLEAPKRRPLPSLSADSLPRGGAGGAGGGTGSRGGVAAHGGQVHKVLGLEVQVRPVRDLRRTPGAVSR